MRTSYIKRKEQINISEYKNDLSVNHFQLCILFSKLVIYIIVHHPNEYLYNKQQYILI